MLLGSGIRGNCSQQQLVVVAATEPHWYLTKWQQFALPRFVPQWTQIRRSVRPSVRLFVRSSFTRRCARIRASIKPNQPNPAPATNYHNYRVLHQFHQSQLKVWINGNLFAATALIAWTALFALPRISICVFELKRKIRIYFVMYCQANCYKRGYFDGFFTFFVLDSNSIFYSKSHLA